MRISGIDVEFPKLEIERKGKDDSGNGEFKKALMGAIDGVNDKQVKADHAVEGMLTGESRNIHETMIALEKADISLKLMTGVRNKALEAYNTIMRMQG